MADDERTSFSAGNGTPATPAGANWVEFTWIVPGGGMLGRDRTVPRSQATHAKIVEAGGTAAGTRTVPLVDANVYLAEIERFHAERKAAAERAAAERAESQAHLASVCPHCDLARSYQGVRNLQVGSVGAELIMGELLSVSNAKVHWYVCPSCGSVEQFAVGVVPHPLAGNRPPGQPG